MLLWVQAKINLKTIDLDKTFYLIRIYICQLFLSFSEILYIAKLLLLFQYCYYSIKWNIREKERIFEKKNHLLLHKIYKWRITTFINRWTERKHNIWRNKHTNYWLFSTRKKYNECKYIDFWYKINLEYR